MRRAAFFLLAAALPLAAVHAAALVVTKTAAVVSDGVSQLNPKAIPNAEIEYTLRIDNPNGILSGQAIGGVVIEDAVPASVALRVADYGAAGSGPVEFTDGDLLGLLGSGLSFGFGGLGSATDGLAFSDGTDWTYTPVPDASGYDPKVRGVRFRLGGTQTPGSSFRLRFRVRVK